MNRFELENMGKIAAMAYLKKGANLNDTIMDMAKNNDFTDHQVCRVVENANILVNGALVKKAREEKSDPRVTFKMAEAHEIIDELKNGQRKEAVDRQRVNEIRGMFHVKKAAAEPVAIFDDVRDPYANEPQSFDHMELARKLVSGEKHDLEKMSWPTLSLTNQTLESLHKLASDKVEVMRLEMDDLEKRLKNEICDEMLSGHNTATIRDVVKMARLENIVERYVDETITKVACDIDTVEGKSRFSDTTDTINDNHPIFKTALAIEKRLDSSLKANVTRQKIAKAIKVVKSAMKGKK